MAMFNRRIFRPWSILTLCKIALVLFIGMLLLFFGFIELLKKLNVYAVLYDLQIKEIGAQPRTNLRIKPVVASTSTVSPLLHQIYASDEVPSAYYDIVQNCRKVNSNLQYILWTDRDADRFVSEKYPELLSLYRAYNTISRSDFLRYAILYHYGGFYLDMDMECLRPLDATVLNATCFVDSERVEQSLALHSEQIVAPSAMGCRPRHPFMAHVLTLLPAAYQRARSLNFFRRWQLGADTTFYITGPRFLTHAVRVYSASEKQATAPIVVAPSWAFSPLLDPVSENLSGNCGYTPVYLMWWFTGDGRYHGCIMLGRIGFVDVDRTAATARSMTVHRYLHIGWNSDAKRHTKLLRQPVHGYAYLEANSNA